MPHHWSWTLLRAGEFRLDGGGMFGVVPKVLWSRMTPCDELNRVTLNTNCLLLRDGTRTVLVETGFGDKWSDKDRAIFAIERRTVVDALREVGVAPEQVTHIVVTHLHFDHAAGLTQLDGSGRAVPVFANAPVFVQRTEWEDALANKSTMTRTYLRDHLDPIADRVRLLDGECAIPDLPGAGAGAGVRVLPMPGHTWGMQAIVFEDDQGVVCFPGDVIPTVHHVGLAFSIGYDMLPHQNMLTKKALLTRAAAENWRLALDHDPGPAVHRVRPSPDKPGQFVLTPDGDC